MLRCSVSGLTKELSGLPLVTILTSFKALLRAIPVLLATPV